WGASGRGVGGGRGGPLRGRAGRRAAAGSPCRRVAERSVRGAVAWRRGVPLGPPRPGVALLRAVPLWRVRRPRTLPQREAPPELTRRPASSIRPGPGLAPRPPWEWDSISSRACAGAVMPPFVPAFYSRDLALFAVFPRPGPSP